MKKLLHNKAVISLAVVLALIIVMGILSFTVQGESSPVANIFGVMATPFRSAADGISGFFEEMYARNYEFEELQAENERLRKRIADMEADVRRGEQLVEENERLRELVGVTQARNDLDVEMANIVSRGSSNWESTFTISKGTGDGVEKFDCVISSEGFLVGQITEAGENWAVVSTVIDTTTSVGAKIYRTGDVATALGDFELMYDGKLKLAYFPESAVLLNGDTVLTSGVGEVYPAGLVIGKISDVYPSESGAGSYAVIEPSVDFESLVQVFVVTDFDINE